MGGGNRYKLYGVKFDPKVGNPGNRMYDAVKLNFTPSNPSVKGIDDFINLENGTSPFGIKECATKYNPSTGKQEIMTYKGQSDWSSAIADPNHNRMIEFPKFYYKRPSRFEWIVSSKPFPGSSPSPMHYRNGVMHDKCYVSKYTIDANYLSQSGGTSLTNKTIAEFRDGLRSNGMYLFDYAALCSINMLMFIKYNSMNGQDAIGYGNAWSSVELDRGSADTVLGVDGYASNDSEDGFSSIVTFGIENYWGNLYKVIDGIFRTGEYVYINTDIENIIANPTASDFGGFTIVESKIITYTNYGIKNNIVYDSSVDWALFPSGINISSGKDLINDTYYGNNSSGLYIVLTSGSYQSQFNAGPLTIATNNVYSSYKDSDTGAFSFFV